MHFFFFKETLKEMLENKNIVKNENGLSQAHQQNKHSQDKSQQGRGSQKAAKVKCKQKIIIIKNRTSKEQENFRKYGLCIIRMSEKEKRKQRRKIFEVRMAENFP